MDASKLTNGSRDEVLAKRSGACVLRVFRRVPYVLSLRRSLKKSIGKKLRYNVRR